MRTIVAGFACVALGLVSARTFARQAADDAPADAASAAASPAAPVVANVDAKVAEAAFEAGRKAFFQGETLAAIAKLKEAVAADPSKTSYRLLLAKAHRALQQDAAAIELFEAILKTEPEHVEAATELAELLSPQKEPQRVIALLQPLLKLKHTYSLHHLLAEAHARREEFDAARRNFEEAIRLNPRNPDDHYQLGSIHLAQKRFARAAASLEEAERLGFSTGVFHFKLASAYFNLRNYLGRVETAEIEGGKPGELRDGRYLIDAAPGRPHAFHVAGPKSAVYQTAKARQMGIDLFEIRFLEGNLWLSVGDFARAETVYAALEPQVRKEDAGVYWSQRSQAALGRDDFDAYLAHLKKAIAAQPDVYAPTLSDALLAVARRWQLKGDDARHLDFLRQAVEANPLSARLQRLLGDAYWSLGRREEAIRRYRLTLELEPESAQRVELLNRILGHDEPAAATSATAAPAVPVAAQSAPATNPAANAPVAATNVRCLFTGKPIDPQFAIDYRGGKVQFCCANCRAEFAANPAQAAARANHQLLLSGQAKVEACPLTGRPLNADYRVEVAGATVPLCCGGCKGRVDRAKEPEKIELLFEDARFAKHYRVGP